MYDYDLSRFTEAHRRDYETALAEVRAGCKESHWMWYIFPQIKGLGFTPTSRYYSIEDVYEAEAFINDSYLGENLREICAALLKADTRDPEDIFGETDAKKLRSSMTLFSQAADDNSVFLAVLTKFFGGEFCQKTLDIIDLSDM